MRDGRGERSRSVDGRLEAREERDRGDEDGRAAAFGGRRKEWDGGTGRDLTLTLDGTAEERPERNLGSDLGEFGEGRVGGRGERGGRGVAEGETDAGLEGRGLEVWDGDGALGPFRCWGGAREEAVGPAVDVDKERRVGGDVGPDERKRENSRDRGRDGGRCANDDRVWRGVLGQSSHGEDSRAKPIMEPDPLGPALPVVEGVGRVPKVVVGSVWSRCVDGQSEGRVGPAHSCHTECGCRDYRVVLPVCLVVWGWVSRD